MLYEIHYYDESKKVSVPRSNSSLRKGMTMLAPDEKLKLSTASPTSRRRRALRAAPTRRATSSNAALPISRRSSRRSAPSSISTSTARARPPTQSTARWRAGRPRSPIDGMPIGIKDIIETADMPTEQGSPLFAGCRSERDAASVAALREAGAVIVGKTVTTEFAATEPRGTRNPHDLRRTPGRIEQRLGRRRSPPAWSARRSARR